MLTLHSCKAYNVTATPLPIVIPHLGVIYTSEIKNWQYILGSSLWTNVTLTDSALPIAAKHFAFGFESHNINNLFKFQYSLLNDKGKIIEFKQGETKVPTLNFSIQILA